MFRHIYFLTLLLYINKTFSLEYLLDEEQNDRSIRKYPKSYTRSKQITGKINGKRQDYEMVYDNDPVAQIDVASFIQSPDDNIDSNQPYEGHDQRKQFYSPDYGSLMDNNEDFVNEVSIDQQSFIPNQLPEVDNIYSKTKHIVPQNIYLNGLSLGDHNEIIDPHKINAKNRINGELSFDIGHNPEKKCALRNMKIPFFSRNKDAKIKEKKNKKRRLFGFGKLKKQTQSVSKSGTYLNINDIKRGYTEASQVYNKVKKRSYFERLCPSCRKIIKNDRTNSQKSRRTPNGIIHNSRQFYQGNSNKENGNKIETPSIIIKYKNFEHNLDLNSLKDTRQKRELDLSIVKDKQKKELKRYRNKITAFN